MKKVNIEIPDKKEFIIVGDNNFWYAQGFTDKKLKQAYQSLKLVAKAIKKRDRSEDDIYEVNVLHLFVGEEVERLLLK